MIKKKLIVLLSMLFVMFLFLNSSVKALTYDFIQNYVSETAKMYPNNTDYQFLKNVFDSDTTKNYINNNANQFNNKNNIYIYNEGSGYCAMQIYNTLDRISNSGMYMTGAYIHYRYNGSYWYVQTQGNDRFTSPSYCYSTSTNQFNNLKGMNFTYNQIEDSFSTPATYVGNQGLYRINELEFINYFVNNKVNTGTKLIYYYKGNLYGDTVIPIGEIERNDAYHYEIWLTEDSTNTDLAYLWVDYYTGKKITSNHQDMWVSGSDMLCFKTLSLNYNETYRVTITSYYGDIDEPTIKSIENLFIFLPKNTNVSGDVINFISGDYISNDTIQIIGSSESQTENILGTLTEVPGVTSGDLVNNFEVVEEYENTLVHNFFYDMLLNISDIFLQDEEVNLKVNLPIFNREINIRSDFWITRNYLGDEFYDFIQSAWWVLICYIMLVKVDLMIELFNFGDFIGAIGEIYQTRRLL